MKVRLRLPMETLSPVVQFIVPARGVEMRFQSHFAGVVGNDHRLRRQLHDFRNIAGMVHLNMVDDNVADLGKINHAFNALCHFLRHIAFDAVNERNLLIHDQIGVVSRAVRRGVTVKFP